MAEFNLLGTYPRMNREKIERDLSPEALERAARLDFFYYDGDRKYGFGGYRYDGRWRAVAAAARERYGLHSGSRVLVDRCDKGFLIYDLMQLIPGITVYGLSPSVYTINHALEGYGRWFLTQTLQAGDPALIEDQARRQVVPFMIHGHVTDIPFKDGFFDTVISINSACAYPEAECRRAVREILRVTRDRGARSYVQNDSWRNERERQMLLNWTLLCKTFLDTDGWARLYAEEGYHGDWGFTIIE